MHIRSDLCWSVTNWISGIAVTQHKFSPNEFFFFPCKIDFKECKNSFKSKIKCCWNDMKPFKVGAN